MIGVIVTLERASPIGQSMADFFYQFGTLVARDTGEFRLVSAVARAGDERAVLASVLAGRPPMPPRAPRRAARIGGAPCVSRLRTGARRAE